MTWTASLLPDDALPPDSLVKRIIDADKVRPELLAEAEEFLEEYADDFKALAASERADLPLWRVMQEAGEDAWLDSGYQEGQAQAAQIEALRDHMLPPEPEPTSGSCLDQRRAIWRRDNQIREYLTEQARIARDQQ